MSHAGGSAPGAGRGHQDPEGAGRDAQRREDADRARRTGFEFLGYKIKRGRRPLKLAPGKIRSGVRQGDLYAYPREKSIEHFKDQIRQRTRRKAPVSTRELIAELNPVIRGWGQYFCKAHIRKLFARLDRWILRRIWSQRFKRWRVGAGTASGASAVRRVGTCAPDLPDSFFEPALLTRLCESWMRENRTSSLSGGRRPALRARLLRPDSDEAG